MDIQDKLESICALNAQTLSYPNFESNNAIHSDGQGRDISRFYYVL